MADKMIDGYTLKEAQEMLVFYKQAEKDLVNGQAKSYKIGSREVELFDIGVVSTKIKYFAGLVNRLNGSSRSRCIQLATIRDL